MYNVCEYMYMYMYVGNKPSTLCSSGVIVAHFIPTLYFLIASAHSTVTVKNVKGQS